MAEVPRARVLRAGRRRVGGVGEEPSRAGLRLVWLARVESVWLVQKEVVFWTPGFCEPSDLGWDEGGLWALCPGLAEKSEYLRASSEADPDHLVWNFIWVSRLNGDGRLVSTRIAKLGGLNLFLDQ